MENKKYLDKVIGSLVRSTKVDYEEGRLYTPFTFPYPFSLVFSLIYSFSSHCKKHFGLIDDEVKYVWKKYKEIIKDKIKDGE